ncbi:hypothetical protein ACQKC5_18890 [Shewanella baltica]|uniref:hypothetical protein n=1 Tax=Shewanella TaxID=22 RepID=UPI001563FD21|nr:hypothetical protein [Shewanella sp. DC2-4]NRD34683.1 hypothetical protein [Shewanella sp. DC2-4]
MIDKLLKPMGYIRIRHSEKYWFDLFIPALLAVLIATIIFILPKPIILLGKDSLIGLVNGILQILSGFYIASMAAVATFQKEGMDEYMVGAPPKLKGQSLTRRNFLTYLFGYLAFMSILMYFVGGFIQLSALNISFWIVDLHSSVKFILVTAYLFVICNILTTTVLGMHFLIDKIHREEPKFVNEKGDKPADKTKN